MPTASSTAAPSACGAGGGQGEVILTLTQIRFLIRILIRRRRTSSRTLKQRPASAKARLAVADASQRSSILSTKKSTTPEVRITAAPEMHSCSRDCSRARGEKDQKPKKTKNRSQSRSLNPRLQRAPHVGVQPLQLGVRRHEGGGGEGVQPERGAGGGGGRRHDADHNGERGDHPRHGGGEAEEDHR